MLPDTTQPAENQPNGHPAAQTAEEAGDAVWQRVRQTRHVAVRGGFAEELASQAQFLPQEAPLGKITAFPKWVRPLAWLGSAALIAWGAISLLAPKPAGVKGTDLVQTADPVENTAGKEFASVAEILPELLLLSETELETALAATETISPENELAAELSLAETAIAADPTDLDDASLADLLSVF